MMSRALRVLQESDSWRRSVRGPQVGVAIVVPIGQRIAAPVIGEVKSTDA